MILRVHLSRALRSTPRLGWGVGGLLLLAANLAILAGVSGLLIWAWAQFDRASYQSVQGAWFEEQAAAEDPGTPERREVPEAGSHASLVSRVVPRLPKVLGPDPLVIGRLEVPRLGLSVMVREGMDAETLQKAAGHVTSTSLPGEKGNFVVLGHRDSLFRGLRELKVGDILRVRTTRGSFRYAVQSIQVVGPESLTQFAATAESAATLITCFPFNYIGAAPRRFVARARLMDNAQ